MKRDGCEMAQPSLTRRRWVWLFPVPLLKDRGKLIPTLRVGRKQRRTLKFIRPF